LREKAKKVNKMSIDNQYDAIIIGAGSLGTPTAYYLAKAV
jgi:ribulose 1,5-bisphosphate synthetase/thiazole synthase